MLTKIQMTDYTGKNSDYLLLKGVFNFIIPLTICFITKKTNNTEATPWFYYSVE